jgi:hypothetical protein
VLHLSEHAAYNRIETARAARRFPSILGLVESAAVTLTTVRLLAPHLTEANHRDVLEHARHKSKREVELLVATLHPRPDVPSAVRKLPSTIANDDGGGSAYESYGRDTTSAGGGGARCADATAGGDEAHSARALQDSVHCQP